MSGRSLRIFHISDLHMRSADGPQGERARLEAASRWRVLGQAWSNNLTELRKGGVPFDLVVFTGDLADWGHPTDYPRAIAFLKEVCTALEVPLERLFLVPGNHDINRKVQPAARTWLRSRIRKDPRAYSEWMAGGAPRAIRANARRDQILERQQAFWGAVAAELGRPELLPSSSPHKRLGYRQTVTLAGLTQPIHVIGLDTAWLAGNDHDSGELWLTEHQVTLLTTTEEGAPLPGLRLALMHHRLADLADATDSRRLLAGRVDLLLHGHQHEPTAEVLQGPDHQLLVLAAGCLYEGDEKHRYLNACQVIDLVLDENARPCRAAVRFRGWSERGLFWGDDALLYKNTSNGWLRLRYEARGWRFDDGAGAPRQRAPERHDVFIGRDSELADIATAFDGGSARRVAIVAVQGMAGIGKTYLAHEFYARHPGRFGSYQHVALAPEHPGTVATWMTVLGNQVGIDAVRVDEALVAETLRTQRALLHVDNVDSAAAAEVVAALAHVLDGVPMLVTGRHTELGTAKGSGWARIELAPLEAAAALELLQAELVGAGIAVPEPELAELVRQVAGLPLALHLAAGYLRRGVTVERFLARLREKGLALGPRDPADHVLRERARGVLSMSFAISHELMLAEGGVEKEAWKAALEALGWAPRAGFGRSLGAAITGIDEASAAFDEFIEAAVALSLARRLRPEERSTVAWAIHPLLGEFLRGGTKRDDVDTRVAHWIMPRLDDASPKRPAMWGELSEESASIREWLQVASDDVVAVLFPRSADFAMQCGQAAPWLAAAQRIRRHAATAGVLRAICRLALQMSEFDVVREAATELEHLAHATDDEKQRAMARGYIAESLAASGKFEESLRIQREEVLPVYTKLNDMRARAIALGKIADVLSLLGQFDEPLRIRREEQLPVYQQLDDMRRCAITLGQISQLLALHGEPDEALEISRQQLPIFEQLRDEHSTAVTLGHIADILRFRGKLDEALRTYRDEVVPIYERLGDVRSRAITLGSIAEILRVRGEIVEALRIHREDELPVYERVGDVRSRAIALGQIADILTIQGDVDEALRIRREEQLPIFQRIRDSRSCAMTLGQIADTLADRGELDEALRIHQKEEMPIYEKLGDVRSITVAKGKIADVLTLRGELEEALRIRREEELPVYRRLNEPHSIATTWGKIASILFLRREFDEALRIRREEQLPVYERLGDVRERALTQGAIADVLTQRGELDDALRIRRDEELPTYERLGDARERAIALGKIADIVAFRGDREKALAVWRDSLAVFERLREPRLIGLARKRIVDLLRESD